MNAASNHFKHPRNGFFGRTFTRLANSTKIAAVRRAVTSRLPFPVLKSDVRDVVYMNWMVDTEHVKRWVPRGLELWSSNGLTPFTILTYRHGNFGPSALGPIRRLSGSPIQSNWRLYLQKSDETEFPERTVLFVKNIMNSSL